jgi:nanoRNase/pAp phosphatase (c-di-AMP/oligoRNAs hydrolase)
VATTNDTGKKLAALKALLADKAKILIILQDNPDPDGLASAMALRKLANALTGARCSLACNGTVGRAENRAMVRYVNLNLLRLDELDVSRFDLVALVDTQPGQQNNSLPADVSPNIVIDHHPTRRATRRARFTDVRGRYGATATILAQYLRQAGIVPDAALATALLYGIRSDTQDFGREATQADMDAYEYLYALANKRMLGAIQRGRAPPAYFRMLATALANARRCGRCIYCELGRVDNPDMIPEVADLFLRHEDVEWSLCWGYHDGRAMLSVRTQSAEPAADALIRRLVSRKGAGGGHQSMAAGQIPLREDTAAGREHLDKLIRRRYLKATGSDAAACRRIA